MSTLVATGAAVTALEMANKVGQLLEASKEGSLIEYSRPSRVEPLVMCDARVAHQTYAVDIMHTMASMFSAYYMMAFSLSVKVEGVDVIKLLDRLNPNRSAGFDRNAWRGVVSTESFQHQLPVPGQAVGLEAYGIESATVSRDAIRGVNDATNLSVGKLIEVSVSRGESRATFPVQIRLMVNNVRSDSLVHILSAGSKDTSAEERKHGWASGQLKFVRDIIMCQDLIDEHRDALLKDKTGIYASMNSRVRSNRVSAAASLSPSLAQASSIVVISDETVKELERNIGGRLSSYRVRSKLFEKTYTMLMAVVDTNWEQVTIYHRSIDLPTHLSVKDMKTSNKGNGPDVAEILKAYQAGSSPTL